jgi:hypothetical protein
MENGTNEKLVERFNILFRSLKFPAQFYVW